MASTLLAYLQPQQANGYMQLKLYKTLWGHNDSYEVAATQAISANFNGIEGPCPTDTTARLQLRSALLDNQLAYIAEITTAGSYVPERRASVQQHLVDFEQKLLCSMELSPEFISCIGGCDAWPESASIDFFGEAMHIAQQHDAIVSFETHRSRSLFTPWITQRVTRSLPEIKLTLDFSHWCVVCERLMDSELDVIKDIAKHGHHIHARVGYDQGPQVPHPAAPEYFHALEAHQRWWAIIWHSQLQRDYSFTSMTPEFGPDGYLHQMPFTQQPVAELWEINQWIGATERLHFQQFMKEAGQF